MKYEKHFLMSKEDAKLYAVEVVRYFDTTEGLTCEEIGDGNVNYIFRVADPETGRSLIIKQSDTVFRSDGMPLDTRHNKAEAGILQHQGRMAPKYVPTVFHYNEPMCAVAMEDIGAYKNTRKAMLEGETFPTYAHDMVDFLTSTLLPGDGHKGKEAVCGAVHQSGHVRSLGKACAVGSLWRARHEQCGQPGKRRICPHQPV